MLRIKAIRKKLNLKEQDVYQAIGVEASTFKDIELGRVLPDKKVQKDIVEFYKNSGVDVSDSDFDTNVKYKDFSLNDDMNKSNKVVYKGKEYDSVSDLAQHFDVSISTVSRWLSSDRINSKIETRINGKVYKKSYLESLAKKHNLTVSVVCSRIKYGLPFDKRTRGRKSKKYDFHGEKLSLKEISERTGIKLITLVKRAEAGIPLDSPVKKTGRKEDLYEYGGEQYTIKELARLLQLPIRVLKARIKQDTDLSAPYNPRVPRYFYEDDWMTLKEIERKSGLSSQVVQEMADNGEFETGV